jgi:hypothetical protein
MPLAETQAALQRAVVTGEAAGRLRIHARHYEASLVRTLVDRFPATVWLTGSSFVSDAAREYARVEPPARPCLAEYGAGFPRFLATRTGSGSVPYLRDFAEIEWRVGEAAVEVALPSLGIGTLAALGDAAHDLRLTLQPGVRYWRAQWSVDELFSLYLADAVPDRFTIAEAVTPVEICGARGDVVLTRLAPGDFTFRAALACGLPLGTSIEGALARDSAFDPARALAALFAAGHVRSIA